MPLATGPRLGEAFGGAVTDNLHTWPVDRLDVAALEPERLHYLALALTDEQGGRVSRIPVLVLRSREPGPVLGITAAIHGNEVNGVGVIHGLMASEEVRRIRCGAIVAAPVLNLPGFRQNQRAFHDGQDLNRLMPGRPDGAGAQQYAHALLERLISGMDRLLDLHTASFGRVNSLYVRADMTDPVVARMARLLRPEIIVHNPGHVGTLRAAAAARSPSRWATPNASNPDASERRGWGSRR